MSTERATDPRDERRRARAGMTLSALVVVLVGGLAVTTAPTPAAAAGVVTGSVFGVSAALVVASSLQPERTVVCVPGADVCVGA
jgi:hypothetical protein